RWGRVVALPALSQVHARAQEPKRPPGLAIHRFRENRPLTRPRYRCVTPRDDSTATRYMISTMSIRANMARIRRKLGELWSTSQAGIRLTVDRILSAIQLSM